jgi:uncharacterized protein (TIGR00369 family)
MDLDRLLKEAGSYKNLFVMARAKGVAVEEQLQNAMGADGGLFRTVGYKVVKMEEGRAMLSFPFSDAIARRGGMVHGGIEMYTLDNACGMAVMTVNPGVDQVTLELKVNFLEPLKKGPFSAVGKVVRVGGSTAVAEGELRDADDVLCAKSLGTWYMIRRR